MFSNKIVIFSSSKLVEKKVVEKIISQCLSLSNSKLMFLFELIDFSLHFRGRTVGQRSNCPKHELTSDQMTSSLHEVKRWDHRCDYTHTHTHTFQQADVIQERERALLRFASRLKPVRCVWRCWWDLIHYIITLHINTRLCVWVCVNACFVGRFVRFQPLNLKVVKSLHYIIIFFFKGCIWWKIH